VLCVDEKSQIQALDRSAPVLPMMPGMPERRTHDYARFGVSTLFAAFDIANGQLIGSLHRRHRAIEFKKFLAKIDAEVPADLDVHLVCGNLATHKTPGHGQVARRAPTISPALHPDQLVLAQPGRTMVRATHRQKLRRGVHKSLPALEKDIRNWVQTWNENPRPFAWTKSADEIFERLNAYLQRIPGAGHCCG